MRYNQPPSCLKLVSMEIDTDILVAIGVYEF